MIGTVAGLFVFIYVEARVYKDLERKRTGDESRGIMLNKTLGAACNSAQPLATCFCYLILRLGTALPCGESAR